MKKLVLVVHANVQQDLADVLRGLPQVSGFTFTHVEGHSAQTEHDAFLSERDRVVGFVPRVRVDVLLEDADVEPVIAAIRSQAAGLAGQGVYWVVTNIERYGRL